MSKRNIADYIEDIVSCIEEVEQFTCEMTFDEFLEDTKTINASIRSLEVLGEAAKKIPDNIRDQYQNIPWKRMSGMRDKLIHDYFGVDLELVWTVIKEELPPIKPYIQQLLTQIEKYG